MGNINGTIVETVTIDGVEMTSVGTVTGDVGACCSYAIPAATSGTVTTWTDANTGVITASGHTITTGDKVDVYWMSGSTRERRVGMDATVSGSAVTVDGGQGDDLPDVDTVVTIAEVMQIECACHPANLKAWVMHLDVEGTVCTLDFDGTVDEQIELTANEPYQNIDGVHTNSFSATCGYLWVSVAGTTAGTFKSQFVGDAL